MLEAFIREANQLVISVAGAGSPAAGPALKEALSDPGAISSAADDSADVNDREKSTAGVVAESIMSTDLERNVDVAGTGRCGSCQSGIIMPRGPVAPLGFQWDRTPGARIFGLPMCMKIAKFMWGTSFRQFVFSTSLYLWSYLALVGAVIPDSYLLYCQIPALLTGVLGFCGMDLRLTGLLLKSPQVLLDSAIGFLFLVFFVDYTIVYVKL